jgi:chromate reductase
LVSLNIPAMPKPEAYVGGASNLFDGSGNLANESTREFLHKFMNAFADWVDRNSAGL